LNDTGATAASDQVSCSGSGGCSRAPIAPITTFISTGLGSPDTDTMTVGTDVSSLVTTSGSVSTGQTATLNLGTVTNENPNTTDPDDGPKYRSVVIRFALAVQNINDGTGGATLRNQNDDLAFNPVSTYFVNPEAPSAGAGCPSATPADNCALSSD